MSGANIRMVRIIPVVVALLLVADSSAQTGRAPTVDDLLDLVQVTSPQISPDGSRVLYTRSDLKPWKENTRVTSIWIARADGSDAYQFLGHERDRSPAWSPDGRFVAFLSNRDQSSSAEAAGKGREGRSGPQIYVIRAQGGEAEKLTDHKGSIRSFEWAHDSTRVFFSSDNVKSDEEQAAEKAGDDAIYVDEQANGQSRGRFSKLWVIGIHDRKERAITSDDRLIGDFMPSPDDSRIAFTYRRENVRNHQYKSEIAVVDVASGQVGDLTSNETPEGNLRWSPDGQLVSFTAPSDRTWDLAEPKLWVVPAAGGPARRLLDVRGSIGNYWWHADGRKILMSTTRNGRSGAYELDVATGVVRAIVSGDWSGGLESVTRDLSTGASTLSSPSQPGDVHVWNLRAGSTARLTTMNPQVAGFALAQFRAVTWKSTDGLEIEGLLWLPAGYRAGTRLPLVLSIHGGPAGVFSASFRGINHVYAGLGWAVLEPNVRGSSTYGDALLRGNMKDIGGGDYQDLITGVDALIAQGIADPDRLVLRGWSYGGILGGWTITQTDRFKAASLGAMVSDWASEYAMGFNHDIRLWYIGGTPWDNPEGYRRQSPFTHIAKVKTPTILLHGEEDTTDTVGQSMIYYQGLKDRGVPVRFIRFPREPHGLREPHHQRLRDMEEIAWLMKYGRGIAWPIPARQAKPAVSAVTTSQ
jgi:dipeptidyl aminopeptidase/acylaminoacyl peptidase